MVYVCVCYSPHGHSEKFSYQVTSVSWADEVVAGSFPFSWREYTVMLSFIQFTILISRDDQGREMVDK